MLFAGRPPRPLAAAGARQPEGKRRTACGQTCGATDRREAESARLGAQRGHGRRHEHGAARPVVHRPATIEAEARPVRTTTAGAEVDGRMGDEAGHHTHSHARHCTPHRWPRKQFTTPSDGRGTDTAPPSPRPVVRPRNGPHRPSPVRQARRVGGGSPRAMPAPIPSAPRDPLPGPRPGPAPSMPSRTESRTPGPSMATAGSPAANASASTSPCVSVRDANAKRSAPATTARASMRGRLPVNATRPARSAASALARSPVSDGPPPTTTKRKCGPVAAAAATASRMVIGLFSGARRPSEATTTASAGQPNRARTSTGRQGPDGIDVDAGRDDVHRVGPAGHALAKLAREVARRRDDRLAGSPRIGRGRHRSAPRRGRPAARGSGRSRRSACGG